MAIGGFSGSKDPTGVLLNKKYRMLESEGVIFTNVPSKRGTDTSAVRVDTSCVLTRL